MVAPNTPVGAGPATVTAPVVDVTAATAATVGILPVTVTSPRLVVGLALNVMVGAWPVTAAAPGREAAITPVATLGDRARDHDGANAGCRGGVGNNTWCLTLSRYNASRRRGSDVYRRAYGRRLADDGDRARGRQFGSVGRKGRCSAIDRDGAKCRGTQYASRDGRDLTVDNGRTCAWRRRERTLDRYRRRLTEHGAGADRWCQCRSRGYRRGLARDADRPGGGRERDVGDRDPGRRLALDRDAARSWRKRRVRRKGWRQARDCDRASSRGETRTRRDRGREASD